MRQPRRGLRLACGLLASVPVVSGAPMLADVVTLPASKDNTLYESQTGALSNGAGQHLFAGMTAIPEIRRALIAFDLTGAIPAGSTITNMTLTLNISTTIVAGVPVALHRVAADWGEGTSNAFGAEGMGAPSTPDDATWVHTLFDTSLWTQPGGDFAPTASATTIVDAEGPYTWGSTAEMVADAQSWLDSPATNFGWALVGDESVFPTAKRFDSLQHPTVAVRPALRVEFTPPAAGRVPDGGPAPGTPLTAELTPGGDFTLSWGASCRPTDTDFAIYEGDLGDFTSHAPRFCSTAASTTVTLTPSAGSSYYLVVPTNGSREGSYGTRSDLAERPASLAACLPQSIASCP